MESPSRILEVLHYMEERTNSDPTVPPTPAVLVGWRADVLWDAARFLTLLYQDCGKCEGSGVVRWCSLCKEPHRRAAPFIGCAVGDKPCPSCGGSGEVPKEVAIEIVARGIARFFDDWCDDAPYWPTDDLMIHDHDIRDDARAVLMALRTIGDEG